MLRNQYIFCVNIFCGLIFIGSVAFAQNVEKITIKDIVEFDKKSDSEDNNGVNDFFKQSKDLDPFLRGTPRSTVIELIQALKKQDLERAVKYLSFNSLLSSQPNVDTKEIAYKLGVILSRVGIFSTSTLSDDFRGDLNDGLPSNLELFGKLVHGGNAINLYLQRQKSPKGQMVWVVASGSVAKIPEIYEYFEYHPFVEKLAHYFPKFVFFSTYAIDWYVLFVIFIVGLMLAKLSMRLVNLLISRKKIKNSDHFFRLLSGPGTLALFVFYVQQMTSSMHLSVSLKILKSTNTTFIVCAAWITWRLVDFIELVLSEKYSKAGRENDKAILRPLVNFFKVILVFVFVLIWFKHLGYNVTTLVAGLGVGSVAIALAAQKSLENVFGALTLYVAKPVKVGDFCKFGEISGTLEVVGLRSSLIRTLDRTLVAIPNSVFSSQAIVNFSAREYIRYDKVIEVDLGTSVSKLREVLSEIEEMLTAKSTVSKDRILVRLFEITKVSLKIKVDTYIDTVDYNDYLAVAEEINLAILTILEDKGVRLASISFEQPQ